MDFQVVADPTRSSVVIEGCAEYMDSFVESTWTIKATVDSETFLAALSAQHLDPAHRVVEEIPGWNGWFSRNETALLTVARDQISLAWKEKQEAQAPYFGASLGDDWDLFFLDAFSVVEDQESQLRDPRELVLGQPEKVLLDVAKNNPETLHLITPRDFEVFVAALLTDAGFGNVKLSRYCKDGGYDIWAVYCDGEREYAFVVEVKQYLERAVGIEIVDRLNGVRDRVGADCGMVVCTSSFSAPVLEAYSASSSRMSLIDFDSLSGLLQDSPGWHMTSSGILTPHLLALDSAE